MQSLPQPVVSQKETAATVGGSFSLQAQVYRFGAHALWKPTPSVQKDVAVACAYS